MVLVVGITGASGAIYGVRLLEVLARSPGVEVHLVISEAGEMNIEYETGRHVADVKRLAHCSYSITDIGAALASGSFRSEGMIVAPCSVKTLSALANSYADNLLTRAGDVTLKERRKLVLLVRETPLNLSHIKNMERLAQMGAVIMPPVPAFYHRPRTIEDLVDYTVGKVLDIFSIEHDLFERWAGLDGEKRAG